MNSTDGIGQTPQNAPDAFAGAAIRRGDSAKLSKSAEEYVAIQNRLAAQHEKPTANPQFTSIFDQLRERLGK